MVLFLFGILGSVFGGPGTNNARDCVCVRSWECGESGVVSNDV